MGEQDFLVQIRNTEQEAADILEKARQAAKVRLEHAREQSISQLALARDEAANLQQRLLSAAEKKAADILAESQIEAEKDSRNLAGRSAERLTHAAQSIVERIVITDANR